jgi:hypothetical protein
VLIEDFVLSNNGHEFDRRLGDEHAVAANKKKAQQKTRLVLPVGPLEFRLTGHTLLLTW